jgi:ribose-phosphate pyrophosphokinase
LPGIPICRCSQRVIELPLNGRSPGPGPTASGLPTVDADLFEFEGKRIRVKDALKGHGNHSPTNPFDGTRMTRLFVVERRIRSWPQRRRQLRSARPPASMLATLRDRAIRGFCRSLGWLPQMNALPSNSPDRIRLVPPDVVLLAGSASQHLGHAIANYLGCELGASEVLRFSEGNLLVRVGENVRGRDVFIVQGTAFPANDNFMELLFWIDALKRASAASVTAVIPYFGYAKGDKKDEPRVSIRARVCADAIQAAGADRVVTLDLHAPQVQGFFTIPVDDLYSVPILSDAVSTLGLDNLVVVAPDAGSVKKARLWATRLKAPTAIADKRRPDHSEVAEIVDLMGSVEGRTTLIVDDFVISGGTLADCARVLIDHGATAVYAAVSHGLMAGNARETLDESPIRRLFMTDSVETQPGKLSDKIEVVSVAGLFGEAIRRIAERESISVLFN